MDERNDRVIINGTVESVTFCNQANGFTVFEFSGDEDGEIFTAVGTVNSLSPGEKVTLTGVWQTHQSFGRQLKVELVERRMPESAEQLYKYLSSGVIRGVGPATAEKIVAKFGEDSFDVIENDCLRLTQIKGISPDKARKISNEFRNQFAARSTVIALEQYGMTAGECLAAFKRYGVEAAATVRKNPYRLCVDIEHISFERAEEIASKIPDSFNRDCRSNAGLLHIVKHNLYSNGHTCLPREKLIKPACDFLDITGDEADIAIDALIEEKHLITAKIKGRDFLFLPSSYNAEKKIAQRIDVLLRFPPEQNYTVGEDIDRIEIKDKIKYGEKQREAIEIAVNKGILILTGGPGTGKTTTLKGMLRLFQRDKLDIVLAAPTGRAAQRMTEVTGCEAKTIHRLLEVEWDENDRPVFKRNLRNPLEAQVLIVDELSMVDIHLFASLMDALPFGCRLIMVGDSNQLPPVGAGNVLHDLIDSGLLPVVELNEIFRQAQQSQIVTNAHKIVRGEEIDLTRNDGDFFFVSRGSGLLAARTVRELYCERLPAAYGYNPVKDIQILCPSRKGEAGTVEINKMLQEAVNPYSEGRAQFVFRGSVFRSADKVMQIKNNYNLEWEKDGERGTGIFNGDIGFIEDIDTRSGVLYINFDGKRVEYPSANLEELELSYAVTVHKSQGSEFDCVLLTAAGIPPQLCYRNLLYTAVTRARENLIIVGSENQVSRMIENDKKTRRYSALKHFLTEGVNG
ncbi:MAG: ATP-dependent RecD-like DNA helicase [Clostridiales bacterium]|nr:ATP-dependent RecD-like DNA helicase [Clostridiales bacterium]